MAFQQTCNKTKIKDTIIVVWQRSRQSTKWFWVNKEVSCCLWVGAAQLGAVGFYFYDYLRILKIANYNRPIDSVAPFLINVNLKIRC